jgi:hypothetical protein
MKRPFESIRETFSNSLERVRENQIKNFENAERLLVWIVGFSIGGISIIFSNITTINQSYCEGDIRIVLYSLCLSSISGLLFRWAFFKMQLYYQQIEFFLEGAFSNTEAMMETNPQDLSNINEINEIIRKLKSDYNLDYNYILETFDSYDEANQEIIKQNLKDNYKIAGDNVKREYNFSMDYVQNVYSNAFGVSKEKVQKLLNKSPSKLFKIYSKLSDTTFIISCLSFLFAIIYLVILY